MTDSAFSIGRFEPVPATLAMKLARVSWIFLGLIMLVALCGMVALYSAANGSFEPWAARHALRFGMSLVLLLAVALIDIRLWLRAAYILYLGCFALLGAVEIMGEIGMGAQRWIDLGVIQLQPSELMKICLVLALARYFHGRTMESVGRITTILPPVLLVLAPTALVLMQPDLGTALMLLAVGGALLFLAGVRLWKFALALAHVLAAIPVAWQFLHDYQKQRVLTFLDPERDPLGAGYHILQSKIALGAGGIEGRGFLAGTQSHLNFLPEKQTDFIFTLFAEEWGLMGAALLLGLYALLILYGYAVAMRTQSHFGRLMALGLTINLFLYVFINVAMVMGLLPVVGVPLPLVSYGGTAMLAAMIGFGLIMNVRIHSDLVIPRRYASE